MPTEASACPTSLPAITDADAAPARELLIELETSILTQPLHYRSGDEEAAAASAHQIFLKTRELLLNHPAGAAFDVTGRFFLNAMLRPHTARWHRSMVDKRFVQESARRQFRVELKKLQDELPDFLTLLRHLVTGKKANAPAKTLYAKLIARTPNPNRPASLGHSFLSGIGGEVKPKGGTLPAALATPGATPSFATVADLNRAEGEFILRRREAVASMRSSDEAAGPRPADPVPGPVPAGGGGESAVMDATGICLSGGGIRSATFCLGIVQVLARQGLFQHLDYLSTVSGGGYLGTFLSAFLGTPELKDMPGVGAVPVAGLPRSGPTTDVIPEPSRTFRGEEIKRALDAAFRPSDGVEPKAVRHLRNNSRYLLNGGVWGRIKIFGVLVTGILTNVLLMVPLPLLGVLAVALLHFGLGYWGAPDGAGPRPGPGITPAGWVFGTFAVALTVCWLGLPVVRNKARGAIPGSREARWRVGWETVALLLGLATMAAGLLLLVLPVFRGLHHLRAHPPRLMGLQILTSSGKLLAAFSAVAPFVFGLLAARLKAGAGKRWTTLLFTLSGPLFYLVVFLVVGLRVLTGDLSAWLLCIITGVLLLWGWLGMDINAFSPHDYYRNRLCDCYLAARGHDQTGYLRKQFKRLLNGRQPGETLGKTGVGRLQRLRLSAMNATGAAPYHLVNTAVNLPSSHEPNLRGRDCDFFTLTRDYCGGPVCGYVKTETLEGLDPHMDLGTAMAVSGAAASSNMGVKTMRQMRFLLTLLNVRLGYWLRNPTAGPRTAWNSPGPVFLIREMLGWMHEKNAYLNLSDGGHIENLALYELLRRRCKFIVVVDGGMEPGMECADLMLVQRYAQIDLGVQFDLDLADLALNAQHRSKAYAAFGRITYGPKIPLEATTPGGDDPAAPAPTPLAPGGENLGWLIYLKLAYTGGEPGYVGDYQRQNPEFPHQTTGDQIYDEAQFEAYRRLGECAAESLFREEIVKAFYQANPDAPRPDEAEQRFTTLAHWFQALATSLLRDNDAAFDPSPADAGPSGPAVPPVTPGDTPDPGAPLVTPAA